MKSSSITWTRTARTIKMRFHPVHLYNANRRGLALLFQEFAWATYGCSSIHQHHLHDPSYTNTHWDLISYTYYTEYFQKEYLAQRWSVWALEWREMRYGASAVWDGIWVYGGILIWMMGIWGYIDLNDFVKSHDSTWNPTYFTTNPTTSHTQSPIL